MENLIKSEIQNIPYFVYGDDTDELINKNIDPEIYLLAKEDVCWYNKKDLTSFLISESRSKSFLKNKQKEITDIKIYSKAV